MNTESYVVAVVAKDDIYCLKRMSIKKFARYQQSLYDSTSAKLTAGPADLRSSFIIKSEFESDESSDSDYSLNDEIQADVKREEEENENFMDIGQEGDPFSDEGSDAEHQELEEVVEEEQEQLHKDVEELVRLQGRAAFRRALSRIRSEADRKKIQYKRETINEQKATIALRGSLGKAKLPKKVILHKRRVLSSSESDEEIPRKYIAKSYLGFQPMRVPANPKVSVDEDDVFLNEDKVPVPEVIDLSSDDEVEILNARPKLSQCLKNIAKEWNGVGNLKDQ